MTQRIDRIAQLLNCPVKGEEMRRAITEARKDYLLEDDEDEDDDESSAESDPADDAAPET
ncbi:hypothetical protein ABVN23_08015 [Pseudomonas fluorescens]|uniref:hypothetical protein n=1 Tax=Pseudomonas fluorescens TaxID=294 RepID=UPI000488970E